MHSINNALSASTNNALFTHIDNLKNMPRHIGLCCDLSVGLAIQWARCAGPPKSVCLAFFYFFFLITCLFNLKFFATRQENHQV
jgi:hypothetical protein